jgi:hypothetical protein
MFRKTTTVLYYSVSSPYCSCLAFWQITTATGRPTFEPGSTLERISFTPTFRWRTASTFHHSYNNNHDRRVFRLLSMVFSSKSSSISTAGSILDKSALLLSKDEDNSTSSPPGKDDDHDDDNSLSTGRLFRVYYNDVYEVQLPPKHRFPMKKYRLVRERIQRQILQQQHQQNQRSRTAGYNNTKKQTLATIGTA